MDFIDLALHLHLLQAVVGHPDPQHAEVGAAEVQREEVPDLCSTRGQEGGKLRGGSRGGKAPGAVALASRQRLPEPSGVERT